jgi:hypothetical protein
MLHMLTRKSSTAGANHGHRERPTLCLTWELDPQTGKPVGRWIVEGTEPATLPLSSAA